MWPTIVKSALVVAFCIYLGWWLQPFFTGAAMPNPIMLEISGVFVHWYGALMAAAILAGYIFTLKVTNRFFKVDPEVVLTSTIWLVAGGLAGARLAFVVLKWSEFQNDLGSILAYNQGGLSIHGAVLGGFLALAIYSQLSRQPVLKLANLFVPGLVLGQMIGRFGNFFNSEAFGGPTELPWKMFVAPEFRPIAFLEAEFFHPTFLYEALGLAVILVLLIRFLPKVAPVLFAWYLILYSSLRVMIELFRIDSDSWGPLTIAQWASLALVVVGVWIIYRRREETHE